VFSESSRYIWTVFCWITGLIFALSSILVAFVFVVGLMLWHEPRATIWTADLRYLAICLVALFFMSTATSVACFAARYVQRLTAMRIGVHVTALMFSGVVVLSMAAYCWTIGDLSKKIEVPFILVLSVWLVEPILWYRYYQWHRAVSSREPLL